MNEPRAQVGRRVIGVGPGGLLGAARERTGTAGATPAPRATGFVADVLTHYRARELDALRRSLVDLCAVERALGNTANVDLLVRAHDLLADVEVAP